MNSNMDVKAKLASLSLTKEMYAPATKILLFGSRAKGINRVDSDVDLMLVFGDVDVTDVANPANSVFHYKHAESLKTAIETVLQRNPQTGKPYDIDLVGSHELRFFKKDVLKDTVEVIVFN